MATTVGEANMTINVHMLQHLIKGVENYGPLWTHSAFEFESLNGIIKGAVTGKQKVAHKVVNFVGIMLYVT